MPWHKTAAVLAVIAMPVVLGACSSFELPTKKIDYKSAGKLPPLEIPPDLTSPGADNRYAVPDISPQGSATFSVYNKERSGKVQQGPADLLPDQGKVRVERAGTQRWLVVNAAPGEVWPVVKEFWQELGFIVKLEMPEAGVMETDWAENRAKIPQDPIRNVLSKVVDGLYSTAERDKFRTRLERAGTGNTEIYISHRGMYEVIQGGDGGTKTIWEPRPADPELEAEMLRRLMVRFGVEEVRSQAMLTAAAQEHAKIERNDAGGSLSLYDPFDRAWRRVGLALDRIGLALWQSDMTVVEKLGDEIPPVGAESGHHQAGAAILPLVGHDLVVEERVELIDHEPSPGFGIVQAAFSTNAFSGTRAVDRSYSQFRWTAFGRQVVRLLHTSQPKSATISSTDQT